MSSLFSIIFFFCRNFWLHWDTKTDIKCQGREVNKFCSQSAESLSSFFHKSIKNKINIHKWCHTPCRESRVGSMIKEENKTIFFGSWLSDWREGGWTKKICDFIKECCPIINIWNLRLFFGMFKVFKPFRFKILSYFNTSKQQICIKQTALFF
jgi:hypothetical protein